MNTTQKNQHLIEMYFYDVWSRGELDKLDAIIDPAYINHNPAGANPPPGPSGLKPIIEAMRKGIPDLYYIINQTIITDNRIVAHVTVRGTHLDTLFGIPATGKSFEVSQINIEHVYNGKITEHWRITEELNLWSQLGIVKF